MILCFDLDNVICVTKNKVYKKAKPITKTIKLINQAYKLGFKISIFTGRFSGRCNGKLKKVVENIKRFQKIRIKDYPKSKIITRVSGVKVNNQQDLEDMEKFWGDVVDQVAFVDYMPWENVYQSEYSGIQAPCSDLWRRMFVWWEGKVNPCDVDYKSKLSIGNFNNNSISELWKSNEYIRLRHQHESKLRNKTSPCNRCVLI